MKNVLNPLPITAAEREEIYLTQMFHIWRQKVA